MKKKNIKIMKMVLIISAIIYVLNYLGLFTNPGDLTPFLSVANIEQEIIGDFEKIVLYTLGGVMIFILYFIVNLKLKKWGRK